jgi:cohesin complex subunit SCC1
MKPKPKEKKQIIDSVIELTDGPGAKSGRGSHAGLGAPMTKDLSNILAEPHFLPRSSVVMRLREIREDPLAHFLPTKVTPKGTFFCAAPPGLAPELAALFMRPLNTSPSKRHGAAADGSPSKKRKLLNGDDNDEIEQARRAGSVAPSLLGTDAFGRVSVGPGFDFGDDSGMGMGMDDYEMPIPDFDGGMPDLDPARAKSAALSRMSTPAPDGIPVDDFEDSYAGMGCPIAMFDIKSQFQTQGTQDPEKEPEVPDTDAKGYSKNTVMALGIIRRQLQPVARSEHQAREKVMSFNRMADKVYLRISLCVLTVLG